MNNRVITHSISVCRCILIAAFLLGATWDLYTQITPVETTRYSTQLDQLLDSTVEDSVKFQVLLDSIYNMNPIHSGLPFMYLKKGIALATAKNELSWRGELYATMGHMYGVLVKKDSAEIMHEMALRDFKEEQNSQRILDMHHLLSQMYGSNNSMDKALEHAYATIAICEKNGNKSEEARATLNIAGMLNNLSEPDRARSFAKKAIAIYEEANDLSGLVNAYTYLAVYYPDSLDLALSYMEKAWDIILNDPQQDKANTWIHFYCTRAKIYEEKQAYKKAMDDLNKVDSLSEGNRPLTLTHFLDYKKAAHAHQLKRYEEAEKLFLKNVSDSLAYLNIHLYDNYSFMVENYIKLNRWDSAYHYHMIVLEQQNKEKLHESKLNMEMLKTKYETDKKEDTILAQDQRIAQQRIIQWLVVGLAILLGLFLFQAIKSARIKNRANKKLQELDALKTKLYTNITHEFRTPLTIIGGMAAQVQENPEEWFNEGLVMIQRNTDRLLELVNQMLDLSKLESGKISLQNQQGDLVTYLKYIVESMHSFAESNKIQLHFHTEDEELIMDFDAERIQQIMINLLSNAVKFTPEEGHVYVFVRAISKKESSRNIEMLQIKVKDTGGGIPEEQLAFIFDRFHQVDDSATRAKEGTGIGLALVKELVNLMEGDISVKSNFKKQQRGQGTEFTLLLPINNVATKIHTSSSLLKNGIASVTNPEVGVSILEKEENESFLNTNKPSLLLIEDNPDVVTYIASCLQDQYQIMVAINGQEGIDIGIDKVPDLIITDVMMPIKDGFEVCHTLKTDQRTSHIPIIMLTAKADMESKMQGLEKGADVYLAKPFHKKELLIRIKKLLELRLMLQGYYLSIATSNKPESIVKVSQQIPAGDKQFVIDLKTFVELHLDDFDLSVEKLCRELGMSHSQLHRKTKAMTGLSPIKFIRFIRLDKAKTMLRNPDTNISGVAYDTGFNDPGYFGRVFKKEFGMTPIEWKEKKSDDRHLAAEKYER